MTFKSFIKGVWAFCSYVFVPQRRPKDDSAVANKVAGERLRDDGTKDGGGGMYRHGWF